MTNQRRSDGVRTEYRCNICSKPYGTLERAKECFDNGVDEIALPKNLVLVRQRIPIKESPIGKNESPSHYLFLRDMKVKGHESEFEWDVLESRDDALVWRILPFERYFHPGMCEDNSELYDCKDFNGIEAISLPVSSKALRNALHKEREFLPIEEGGKHLYWIRPLEERKLTPQLMLGEV